jgi:hypothetical protein
MNIDNVAYAREVTQGTLDGAPVYHPNLAFLKLVEKMSLARANTGQARHLGNSAPIEFDRQLIGKLPRIGATGASEY